MKRIIYFIGQIILHVGAVGAIVYSFLPLASWYLNYRPLWGVDFFLTTTLANLIKTNFSAPYSFWNYAWFGGWPQFKYPLLSMYMASFLANFTDLVSSVLFLIIGATAIFLIGCYFLFYQLSKNVVLAAAFSIFAGMSAGVYQTLTWAGSIPSYISQAALPWTLGFLAAYLKQGNFRWFLAAGLTSGISIWIHPLVFMTYIVPAVTIVIFLKFDQGLALFWKIKHLLLFLAISLLIGLPQFYSQVNFALKSLVKTNYGVSALSTTSGPSEYQILEEQFNKAQVVRIVTDNHPAIFLIGALVVLLAFLSTVATRKLRWLFKFLPYAAIAGYFTFYIWLFGQGISIYHGGWYRLFWSVPVWIGAAVCVLWHEAHENIRAAVTSRPLKIIFLTTATALILIPSLFLVTIYNIKAILWPITYRSQVSSAYPDIINLRISDDERATLATRLVPSWMSGDDTNWRIYNGDQTVNLWWNSYFKMPLARGYLDPPFDPSLRGYIFWQDAAFSQTENQLQLVHVFNYPEQTAVSNALFLADWNAVKYFEGGHLGGAFAPLPKGLENLLVKRRETLEFNDAKYTKRPVTLNYFEFRDDLVSPVLSATNASTLGVLASEVGFETVVRAIAERENVNSQKLIPVKLGRYVDDYSLEELKKFNSLYLYDWDFKNSKRAIGLLTDYVSAGRKIFIETGVEVKLSSGELPELFPVSRVDRRGLGREWSLSAGESAIAEGVGFGQFSPPLFDQDEWKFSFADETDIRGGAQTLLKNQGKIVMASQKIGSGEVIWSGFNLAYHLGRNHNEQEAKFFLNILSSLVDLTSVDKPVFSTEFINANNRLIRTENAKGVLFKEQAYSGWSAKAQLDNGDGSRLKIYKAGPAYPGYMYVPLEAGVSEVRFNFGGSILDKILVLISTLAALFILEEAVLAGATLGRLRKRLFVIFAKRVGRWWEKEDEQ